jgi:hypothetical protein
MFHLALLCEFFGLMVVGIMPYVGGEDTMRQKYYQEL